MSIILTQKELDMIHKHFTTDNTSLEFETKQNLKEYIAKIKLLGHNILTLKDNKVYALVKESKTTVLSDDTIELINGTRFKSTNYTSINLSNVDTSQIIDMSGMFAYCRKLKSLDLSNINTSNVNDMSSMFYECESLVSIDMNNVDTGNVMSMTDMFFGCKNIKRVDLSNMKHDKLYSTIRMFGGCKNLKYLAMPKLTIEKAFALFMFEGCDKLSESIKSQIIGECNNE